MTGKRIFGLDLLRSVAIIIVVMGHGSFLISDYFKSFPDIPLPDGVDLFFVLSGYLIGTIIIRTIEENQDFNFHTFFNFIKRRWFRTLPNYFLFLLVNIILIYFGLIKGEVNKYIVTYFFFFQNFHKPYDFLFWESWSLSIEEWFYLLFPFILISLFAFRKYFLKIKALILFAIIIFLLFPLLYRAFHIIPDNIAQWDLYYRKLVLTRFDTIGFGLLGAYIHWYYPHFWTKIKNSSFVLGILLIAALGTLPFENNVFFYRTFYYTFIGISILLLLPKLESLKSENIPFKPFQFLSKISYSLYLIHVPIVQILSIQFLKENNQGFILVYIAYWVIAILLSALVYKYFERPLTNLRENIRITSPMVEQPDIANSSLNK